MKNSRKIIWLSVLLGNPIVVETDWHVIGGGERSGLGSFQKSREFLELRAKRDHIHVLGEIEYKWVSKVSEDTAYSSIDIWIEVPFFTAKCKLVSGDMERELSRLLSSRAAAGSFPVCSER